MSAGSCGNLLLLQAELDGELDAAEAAALAEHRAGCPVCAQGRAAILAARQAMRGASYHRATPELRRALTARMRAVGAPARRPRPMPWRELVSFGAGAALAAIIVLTVLPMGRPGVVAELVDDHVRALQPGHLLDVISTNQHTVKPWFDGRLDFSPPVKDLAGAGFPLLGGRLDYLHGREVAVLVYSHGKHVVELFVWPASGTGSEPASTDRQGYHVIHWTAGGMSLSAVSDVEPVGLDQFVRDWQRTP
jgi:anti-sigma factor RsiW